MHRIAVVALLLGLLALPATAAADDERAFKQRSASGLALVRAYSDLLVERDMPALRRVVDPVFQIQRTDGSHADRATYLANLPDLRRFAFEDVTTRRSGRILTVRMTATSTLFVDGREYAGSPAPLLTVWQWRGGRWRLVAQGNFNVPRS
jgi:hypothetical protein